MKEMQFRVELLAAKDSDADKLLTLFSEMAESQGDKITLSAEQLRVNLKNENCNALLALVKGKIVGYLAWSKGFHTYDGPFIYIDDIYVTEDYRKQLIGKNLLAELVRIAIKDECQNIEWLVANSNEVALRWFEKIGSKPLDRYQYRRLPSSAFADILKL